MFTTNCVANSDVRANPEVASTNTPEIPSLMEQTERLACAVGELEESLAGLWRFAAGHGPSAPKGEAFPGGPITERLAWCFRTITHCSDMLTEIRSFVR